MTGFAKWWFLNGGDIHRAWKNREYSRIRDYAMRLPQLAWQEAAKEHETQSQALREAAEKAREAFRKLNNLTGDSDCESVIYFALKDLDAVLGGKL